MKISHEIWYTVCPKMDILMFSSATKHKDALTYTDSTLNQSKAAGTAWLILIISNMLGGCPTPPPPHLGAMLQLRDLEAVRGEKK